MEPPGKLVPLDLEDAFCLWSGKCDSVQLIFSTCEQDRNWFSFWGVRLGHLTFLAGHWAAPLQDCHISQLLGSSASAAHGLKLYAHGSWNFMIWWEEICKKKKEKVFFRKSTSAGVEVHFSGRRQLAMTGKGSTLAMSLQKISTENILFWSKIIGIN